MGRIDAELIKDLIRMVVAMVVMVVIVVVVMVVIVVVVVMIMMMFVFMVMFMIVVMVVIVVMVIMVMIMVVMMVLRFMGIGFLAQFIELCGERFFLLHRLQDRFAIDLIPWGRDDRRVIVVFSEEFNAFVQLLLGSE